MRDDLSMHVNQACKIKTCLFKPCMATCYTPNLMFCPGRACQKRRASRPFDRKQVLVMSLHFLFFIPWYWRLVKFCSWREHAVVHADGTMTGGKTKDAKGYDKYDWQHGSQFVLLLFCVACRCVDSGCVDMSQMRNEVLKKFDKCGTALLTKAPWWIFVCRKKISQHQVDGSLSFLCSTLRSGAQKVFCWRRMETSSKLSSRWRGGTRLRSCGERDDQRTNQTSPALLDRVGASGFDFAVGCGSLLRMVSWCYCFTFPLVLPGRW